MRLLGYCIAALVGSGCAYAAPQGTVRTEAATFRVVEVAGGLEEPWALTFLPDGGMLVTEKNGALRLIENGSLREAPIAGTPEVMGRARTACSTSPSTPGSPRIAGSISPIPTRTATSRPPGSCGPGTRRKASPSRR
jgi:hypothetical protein